jgi:DNA-binding CsgD family transcriptional regulator
MKIPADLKEYLQQASKLTGFHKIPEFDQYIQDISHFNPLLNQLDQVVYVLNLSEGKFNYISPNCLEVEGYDSKELMKLSFIQFMDLVHPFESNIVVNEFFPESWKCFEDAQPEELFNLKLTYNYRFKQKDGSYITMLNQFSIILFDEALNPMMTLGTVSNITDIYNKPEMFCRVYSLSKKNEWKKVYERYYSLNDQVDEYNLTPKEIEIIKFVQNGLSSKEIAQLTNRSVETINSQRKSILAKTQCKSLTEVIVLANKHGWT